MRIICTSRRSAAWAQLQVPPDGLRGLEYHIFQTMSTSFIGILNLPHHGFSGPVVLPPQAAPQLGAHHWSVRLSAFYLLFRLSLSFMITVKADVEG